VPIYEYACKDCGHSLDALQKISDDPLLDCPECGKPQLQRLISAPRFRLKGEGWYETDFKKDNQRNLLKHDGEATTSASKTESSESSSAPEKSTTQSTVKSSENSVKSSEKKESPAKSVESKSTASKSE
jgi:putative FmdB family regulatory protein